MFTLYHSDHIRIDLQRQGSAVLRFAFADRGTHAWDITAIEEWERAIDWLHRTPAVQVLLIRSTEADSFCGGLHPTVDRDLRAPADRAAFAWRVQNLLRRLAECSAVTVAWMEGLCLGIGWELALACDYRLAVQRAATRIGCLGEPLYFGGSVLLRHRHSQLAERALQSGGVLSAAEIHQLQLADQLCAAGPDQDAAEDFLAMLEQHPCKRPLPDSWLGLAQARRLFAQRKPASLFPSDMAGPEQYHGDLPTVVGLWGTTPALEEWLAELLSIQPQLCVRGRVAGLRQRLHQLEQRGFFSAVERHQLHERLQETEDLAEVLLADIVCVAEPHNPLQVARRSPAGTLIVGVQPPGGSPLTGVLPQQQPPLLRLCFLEGRQAALFPDCNVPARVFSLFQLWFRQLGWRLAVFPPAARLLTQAA